MDGVPRVLAQLDPYELRHLAGHLADSGRDEQLHALLALEEQLDDGPGNAWFAAKEAVGDGQGYAADIALAAQRASTAAVRAVAAGGPAVEVGLDVRYALISVAITSMSANIAGELLVQLVRHDRWSVEHALANARRQPDARNRGRALALLSDVAGRAERTALEAALASAAELAPDASDGNLANERAGVLVLLAGRLPDHLLGAALGLAREIADVDARCRTLVALAPRLDEPGRSLVLTEVLELLEGGGTAASNVFGPLARSLPPESMPTLIARARAIEHPYQRLTALVALIDELPPAARDDIVAEVWSSGELTDQMRLELLTEAAPYLTEEQLAEVVRGITALSWSTARMELWAMLLPRLSGTAHASALEHALRDADAIDPEAHQFAVGEAATILPLLPAGERRDRVLATAIEALRGTQDNAKHDAVARLAPLLPSELLEPALDIARSFGEEYFWSLHARAVIALAAVDRAAVPAAELERIRARADAMRSDENRGYVQEALARLEPADAAAPPALTQRAVAPPLNLVERLASLATRALPGAADQLLARWCATEDPRLIRLVAPNLQRGLGAAAIALAAAGDDPFLTGRLLTQLFPYVGHDDQVSIADRILGLPERAAATFFAGVVDALPEDRIARALATARRFGDRVERAQLLSTLRPHLPPAERTRVLDEIITALEPEEQYRDMLSWCARQYRDELSQAQLERITCIAGARSDPKQRFDTLAALLPRRSDGHRADALIELLRTARDIDAFSDRRDRLQQIAPGLAALPRERLVQLWHERISELSAQRREHLLADLAGLAPIVAALGGPAAMQGAARAVLQVGAWWP